MTIEVKGDSAKLAAVAERARKLAGALAKGVLATRLGGFARRDVANGFASSMDLEGNPWAPLVSRAGRPLVKSGKLSGSIRMDANAKGFELSTNTAYAPFHQFGAKLKGRWQARTRQGRFKSHKRASKAVRVVLVTRIGPSELPARPFFPGEQLPERWQRAFEREADQFAREYL